MTAPLVHAHDSRIHYKLDALAGSLQRLAAEVHAAGAALEASERAIEDARLKVVLVMARSDEIAADVAILREMLGVR